MPEGGRVNETNTVTSVVTLCSKEARFPVVYFKVLSPNLIFNKCPRL